MKIALCKTTIFGPISGADEIMLNYAVHLHQSGHDVSVVLLYPPSDNDQYLKRLQRKGVPVRTIVVRSYLFAFLRLFRSLLSSALFFLFFVKRAPTRLRKIWQVAIRAITKFHYRNCRAYFAGQPPDLLHVFTPDTGTELMIRAGHELGIPVLYHEMGTPHHMPMLEDYYRRLEKVLPLCTEVAALSPRLAAEWSIRYPFLPSVSVLPLIMEGSDATHSPNGSDNGANNSVETVFGFAARLEEGKGPLVLLDALAKVNRERPLAVARIAGMGPQLLDVKARARESDLRDACELVGYYSDPRIRSAFLNSLDVFVLPSLAEGTPNGIIEAMAHGIPVIATTVGGIPDIINDDSGILVPPGDAAALADAMATLAKNPKRRNEMGAAARERQQKLFAPTVVVPLLLNIYQRVAGNGHDVGHNNNHSHPWAYPQITQIDA
ncbi:MAG TPA: glycosyltransferase family 4 protein [Pyrinomonadaceae bacterium]|nr:glycosyltransferase family 4 protein [Pyrinomonadaceae bacterium]